LVVAFLASVCSLAVRPSPVLTAVSTWSAILAVGATVMALRALRTRISTSERRWRVLDERMAKLEASLDGTDPALVMDADRAHHDVVYSALVAVGAELEALRSDATPLAGGAVRGDDRRPVLPDQITVRVVERSLQDGDPLRADHLARSHGVVDRLPLRAVRLLARELRARGYLVRADDYFARAAVLGTETDARNLQLRRSEIDVMQGAFRPTAPARCQTTAVRGRVLHVVGRAIPSTQSGYTLRTQSTARAQVDQGLEPHVFVQLGITDAPEHTVDVVDGVTYHRPVGPSVFDAGHSAWLQANVDALMGVVHEIRPEVLHAHSDFLNALIARAVADATGIPLVYEARGFWEESWLSRTTDRYSWNTDLVFSQYGEPEAYTWRRAREAEARAEADHVVTLARVMERRIVDAGLPPERLTIVPNAVDGDRFRIDGRNDELAHGLGIPPGAVVVGCITSVVEYEGIDTLIDACARLTRSGLPVWLLVVGDGPVLPALRRQAEELGLRAATFTGRVPHSEVIAYYSVIDIFVVPRRPVDVCHLVTPLKPFEAFAASRAVVLSDVDALREIAGDSKAAELFGAGDPVHLAEVIRALVTEPDRRAVQAATGAQWVRSARSWATNAGLYADVYARLARDRA